MKEYEGTGYILWLVATVTVTAKICCRVLQKKQDCMNSCLQTEKQHKRLKNFSHLFCL